MIIQDHSSSITTSDGQVIYGGEAVGFVITTADNYNIYFSGDTAVFGDMKLINDRYEPHMVILCIGGKYTMNAEGAAYAINTYFADTKIAIPVHYGTFPQLDNDVESFKSAVKSGCAVDIFEPGTTKTYFENSCCIM